MRFFTQKGSDRARAYIKDWINNTDLSEFYSEELLEELKNFKPSHEEYKNMNLLEKYKDNLLVKTINLVHEGRRNATNETVPDLYSIEETLNGYKLLYKGDAIAVQNNNVSGKNFEEFTISCISLLLLFKQDDIVIKGKKLRGEI